MIAVALSAVLLALSAAPTSAQGTSVDGIAASPALDLAYAQVEFVKVQLQPSGAWSFEVAVRHDDQGWDHYADLWQVVDPSGSVLGERVLLHLHETEQPFTRGLSGVVSPTGVHRVVVRARCNVHGFGGREVTVDLMLPAGERYQVVGGT